MKAWFEVPLIGDGKSSETSIRADLNGEAVNSVVVSDMINKKRVVVLIAGKESQIEKLKSWDKAVFLGYSDDKNILGNLKRVEKNIENVINGIDIQDIKEDA